jgi:hypothetical protein
MSTCQFFPPTRIEKTPTKKNLATLTFISRPTLVRSKHDSKRCLIRILFSRSQPLSRLPFSLSLSRAGLLLGLLCEQLDIRSSALEPVLQLDFVLDDEGLVEGRDDGVWEEGGDGVVGCFGFCLGGRRRAESGERMESESESESEMRRKDERKRKETQGRARQGKAKKRKETRGMKG